MSAESATASTSRFRIIAVSVVMAFLLYLDRVCLGEIVKTDAFLEDFATSSKEEIGEFLGAFFLAYALFQVPAGWLSDRFGGRVMLSLYIVIWSLMTGYSGMASSLSGLLLARLALGAAQSGAYSTSSAVIRNWFEPGGRATASSYISVGGRLGGTLAPLLTTTFVLWFGGWRSVLILYCGFGIIAACAYWWIVRDRPKDLGIEDASIASESEAGESNPRVSFGDGLSLVLAILRSGSLWLNSLAQFCLVFGWVYLITWLPTYLKEEGIDDVTGSVMVSLVLGIAIPGQLIGGRLGNVAVRKIGARWGRSLPLAATCFVAGVAYTGCAISDSVWWVVGLCALVSLMTDIGNPTVWAFMQDIGGRDTAAVFGWGNMWGNLGAAASAVAVPKLETLGSGLSIGTGDDRGATLVFATCASMYFVAALAAFGMNATKSVRPSCD
ncbi:MAG: MFS transporter [Planctomycetota bacterium]